MLLFWLPPGFGPCVFSFVKSCVVAYFWRQGVEYDASGGVCVVRSQSCPRNAILLEFNVYSMIVMFSTILFFNFILALVWCHAKPFVRVLSMCVGLGFNSVLKFLFNVRLARFPDGL